MQFFSSAKRKREFILLISFIAVLSAGTLYYAEPLFEISSSEEIQDIASGVAPYGPAGIVSLQFAQVMIAPLPPFTPIVSGFLYGAFSGTFYSFVGAAIGSVAAILLSRRYGRPLVERLLSEKALKKFDRYSSGHGFLPFIVLFTFPGFPDDALCFIAGLTNLDWKKLALISSLGRIPGIAMLAATGSSIANVNTTHIMALSGLIVSISFLSVRYEEKLEAILQELEKPQQVIPSRSAE